METTKFSAPIDFLFLWNILSSVIFLYHSMHIGQFWKMEAFFFVPGAFLCSIFLEF